MIPQHIVEPAPILILRSFFSPTSRVNVVEDGGFDKIDIIYNATWRKSRLFSLTGMGGVRKPVFDIYGVSE